MVRQAYAIRVHAHEPSEAGSRERTAELLDAGMVYFDTSAWNALADHSNREGLIASLHRRGAVVLASAISAGEILKTPAAERRTQLCRVMQDLLGERALLERPLTIVEAAARAVMRGDEDVLLQQTGPGRTLLAYVSHPEEADGDGIVAWLGNLDGNLERFRAAVEPPQPTTTRYDSPDVLNSDAFLGLLLTLPPAVEQGRLSLIRVRELCERSDVWRALAGSLGVVLHEVMSRSPKRKNGHKRPGASDLWQAVYLGVAEVFVTGDERQLEAVSKVSAILHYPRCVVQASEFFAGLETDGVRTGPRCPVCGCALWAAGAGPFEHTIHAPGRIGS